MTIEIFLALAAFALVTSITPGPNNFMLLASGVNFGLRRSVPHMFGIAGGFFSLLLGVGFGLGALIDLYPSLHTAMKVAGGAYLLYLAWRIAMARSMGNAEGNATPLTFLQAAAFQWVNPKAWVMALTAMSLFTSTAQPYLSVLLVSVVFTLVNLPSIAVWAGFGVTLRGFLADPERLKWFNIIMGILLALSLYPMLK